MLRTPFEAPPRKIQVGALQPRNGFRVSRFRDGRLGGTYDCSVAWRRFGDERVGCFGSLVGRWVVRSTLLHFRLQAATYVLEGEGGNYVGGICVHGKF